MTYTYSLIDVILGAFGSLVFVFLLVAPTAGVRHTVLIELERFATLSMTLETQEASEVTIGVRAMTRAQQALVAKTLRVTLSADDKRKTWSEGPYTVTILTETQAQKEGRKVFVAQVGVSVNGSDADWPESIVWHLTPNGKCKISGVFVEAGPPLARRALGNDGITGSGMSPIAVELDCPLVKSSAAGTVVELERFSVKEQSKE